ncbi:hypothetical protein D3C78_308760 [compost metagenome]
MLGRKLADQIGASALLYAAIAYFVFDESFYLEDLSDNYPDLNEELTWWCDDIYSTFYDLFQNLRTFYETTDVRAASRPHSRMCPNHWRASPRPFQLLRVNYYEPDEDLFVVASRDEGDHRLGSVWRLPEQRSQSLHGDWDEHRAVVCLPFKRSRRLPF